MHTATRRIGMFLGAFVLFAAPLPVLAVESNRAAACDGTTALARYRDAYDKTNDHAAARRAVLMTLNDATKISKSLSGFMIDLADGKLARQVEHVVKKNTGVFRIDPKTGRSFKGIRAMKTLDLVDLPMSSVLTGGLEGIATLVSLVTIVELAAYANATGDRTAKLMAIKEFADTTGGLIVAFRAWQGLRIAFNVVGFLDVSLNMAITHAYEIHDEYWWQGYSRYLNTQYRNVVTGPDSWAALAARDDNGAAFNARLLEFWSPEQTSDGIASPAQRAANYYRVPKPQERDALVTSMAKYRREMAAEYYVKHLKPTLDIYSWRRVQALANEANEKLETALWQFCEYVDEMRRLQAAVAKMKAEEVGGFGPYTISMRRNTYTGPPVRGAVKNGTILAFTAEVPLAGEQDDTILANLIWQLYDPGGRPVEGVAKSRQSAEAGGSEASRFRIRLDDLRAGIYTVALTHQQAADPSESRQAYVRFKVSEPVPVESDAAEKTHIAQESTVSAKPPTLDEPPALDKPPALDTAPAQQAVVPPDKPGITGADSGWAAACAAEVRALRQHVASYRQSKKRFAAVLMDWASSIKKRYDSELAKEVRRIKNDELTLAKEAQAMDAMGKKSVDTNDKALNNKYLNRVKAYNGAVRGFNARRDRFKRDWTKPYNAHRKQGEAVLKEHCGYIVTTFKSGYGSRIVPFPTAQAKSACAAQSSTLDASRAARGNALAHRCIDAQNKVHNAVLAELNQSEPKAVTEKTGKPPSLDPPDAEDYQSWVKVSFILRWDARKLTKKVECYPKERKKSFGPPKKSGFSWKQQLERADKPLFHKLTLVRGPGDAAWADNICKRTLAFKGDIQVAGAPIIKGVQPGKDTIKGGEANYGFRTYTGNFVDGRNVIDWKIE